MPIPERQLEIWSHQGSIAQSRSTYATIRNSLESSDSPYADKLFKVFLQGSYGNDTNIYKESDVDIVIRLDSTFFHDLEGLPQDQRNAFQMAFESATYTYPQFRTDVLSQLTDQFGAVVKLGSKAITIDATANRRSSDVLAAAQFRRYHRFVSPDDQFYDEGICFFDALGTRIANYPDQHSRNCTSKHQATNSWFKPLVRILKNMRATLEDEGNLSKGTAPSYYIEGLLYNVPNENFGGNYADSCVNVINWILGADRSSFVCANEQYYLLRNDPNVTWSATSCDLFLNALVDLWKQW
jgi:hypothetical protein